MTLRRVLLLALLALLLVPWNSAQAGWRIGVRIGVPFPFYYRPYTYSVYVAPAPVYYYPPAPVYVQPAPVYVQPAPVYVQPAPTYVQPAPAAPQQVPPPQPVPIR
jgi:hypothetical protein